MIIDGRKISQDILDDLSIKVSHLKKKDIVPHLAIVIVGDDPASISYVRQKRIKGESIGCKISIHSIEKDISEVALIKIVTKLNKDKDIHGLIVQQPLPDQINSEKIINLTAPKKDIDGFLNNSVHTAPIALAVVQMLKRTVGLRSDSEFTDFYKNKIISIIGKGRTGGKPITELLKKYELNINVIDSKTKNTEDLLKSSDLIISCVGKSNVFEASKIKKGSTVLAIGMHKGQDNKLHADFDQEEVSKMVEYYSPVPGGVGPVNVAMLLSNLIDSAESKI